MVVLLVAFIAVLLVAFIAVLLVALIVVLLVALIVVLLVILFCNDIVWACSAISGGIWFNCGSVCT